MSTSIPDIIMRNKTSMINHLHNHDDSDTVLDDSGDEIDSSTCDSVSLTIEESHSNTSRSNTPLSNQGSRKSKSGKIGKSRKKKKLWSVTNKHGKPVTKSKYAYSCHAKEDHANPIFGCEFHQNLRDDQPTIFATVGSNRVTIYECTSNGSIRLLQCFADPDPEENFYTCAWSDDDNGKPLLAAAGARGIIRIFSTASASCVKHYLGHGHAINDLMFHPKDSNLLLSASKDHSLRLWNVKTDICVAIFGGVEGHRDEVLAADIDITGSRMVSCGMDHSLKVWKLKKPEIEKAIQMSYTFNPNSNIPFPTMKQNFPDFSTRDIHRNYVDCAKWFGEFIFSKSCEDQIVCWKAGKTFQNWDEVPYTCTETSVITRLEIKDCDIWFIRFALDFWKHTLALGNKSGKTFIYDLKVAEPSQIRASVLAHPKCVSAIRQTAFSRDGSILICVCDDSTIWRWDISKDSEEEIDK
ncbi:unnamed protein product [Orchesella dallaii]|uniref:Polycomb protein esc n=1 Tax=Orchesella dallaii TaxID=48710 RepID=A0ABP1QL79_9HEXA